MPRVPLCFFLVLICQYTFGQDPSFRWSRSERKPFELVDVRLLGQNAGGYYVLQTKPATGMEFAPTLVLDYFGTDLNRQYTATLTCEAQYDYVGIFLFDEKPWMLAALFDKSNAKNALLAFPIGNGGQRGKPLEIAQIPASRLADRGSFRAGVSPDGRRLAVLAQPDFQKGVPEPATVYLFNGNFGSVLSGTGSFPNNWTRNISNQVLVNNSGTVFVVKQAAPKGYTSLSVHTWHDQQWKHYPLPLQEKQKMASVVHAFTEGGDLLTGGYYTEESKVDFIYGSPSYGTVLQRLSADGAAQKLYALQAFPKKRDRVLVRNIVATERHLALLGENYEREEKGPKLDDAGRPIGFERSYAFFGNEILADGFDADGKLLYSKTINKLNYTQDDNGILHGFLSALVGNQLVILFNDDLWKHDGKKKLIRFGVNYLVPALAKIDIATGALEPARGLTNTGPVGGKNGDMPLRPAVFLRTGGNSFLIRAEHRDAFKMGLLQF